MAFSSGRSNNIFGKHVVGERIDIAAATGFDSQQLTLIVPFVECAARSSPH